MPAPLSSLLDRWRPALDPPVPGRFVVPPAARAVVLAGALRTSTRPILAVVAGEREAEELVEDIELFTSHVVHLPAWETLPFEHMSPNVVTMGRRVIARHKLVVGEPIIVVASVRAVTQRVSPTDTSPIHLVAGEESEFDSTVEQLAAYGYTRVDRTESRGDFSVRGGIIDVYPPGADTPIRLDFFGDALEEIRTYEATSQRSDGYLDAVDVFPAREVLYDERIAARARDLRMDAPWASDTWDRIAEGVSFQGMESWLPWLAPPRTVLDESNAWCYMFDPVRCADRALDLIKEEEDLAEALSGTWGDDGPRGGAHPPLYLPLDVDELADRMLAAPPHAAGPGDEVFRIATLDAVPGDPESVAAAVNRWRERGVSIVIAMDGMAAANRVSALLSESGADMPVVETVDSVGAYVTPVGIHAGFIVQELGMGVVGEQEVAGRRRAHRKLGSATRKGRVDAFRDLNDGDFVVHRHHGIGRFQGLVHRKIAGVERDYLLVEYAGDDRIYIPTDQLASIARYSGGESPRLSRLGGTDWSQTRQKVRKEVAVVADQVVELHKRRAAASGHAFEPDTPWQGEFESAFPYEETVDQFQAIMDVKADMESARPMDRLIFGDVGFGKTEVAIRAMFKAVQGGKQAVMLVPTTLLAQQHFATFEERFAPYPVRIEMLSRFLTTAQQKKVVAGVAQGTVDIVIGTHRLLSRDMEYKDLGLVVVDEEQRFGVTAKDALREMRASVDVLTLTATPIPRTLEMALTGIRDVSNIRTAPEDRHPILTYVGPYDEKAVSAAIRREMLREGQVYVVHNRVQSIDHAVARLQELVPDARFAVAHGQMSEGRLEQVMFDFWNREYDVLVATTIIESGLDVPQVNTLIVERADRLGLAQLYQLRGRVGRSTQRAYAYLFHPTEERIGEDAHRRLEAIGQFSELGSGFDLAMRDLEIRGAGSILSETQSGHIAAVGIDLYTELVADAVNELKGGVPEEPEPAPIRIDLMVDAHLPDDYVHGVEARLESYRRLAAATATAEIDDVVAEWMDRFGELPASAETLISVARLRAEALRIGITEIVQTRREVRITPVSMKASQEVRLERIARGALLRGQTLFLPPPDTDVARSIASFLRTMWPDPTDDEENT